MIIFLSFSDYTKLTTTYVRHVILNAVQLATVPTQANVTAVNTSKMVHSASHSVQQPNTNTAKNAFHVIQTA